MATAQRKGPGRPGKPCTYRGKAYPSRSAAAKACGVAVSTVSKALLGRHGYRAVQASATSAIYHGPFGRAG